MKSKLIIICMFLLVLLSVCAVSAQDCENETQMTQISNDTLLADSSMTGNFDELKKEIDNAGSTVYLNKDYKGFEDKHIDVNKKDFTIDGQGHTIDCDQKEDCYLFSATDSTMILKNLIIKNGKNDDNCKGGAIFMDKGCKLTVINCTFMNNWADDYGGAIYNNDINNELTIINSTFSKNVVDDDDGGAIYSKGNVNIINSRFSENKANIDGGAIYCEKVMYISSSTFTSNEAKAEGSHKNYGGAICSKNEIYLEDSVFDSNYADDDGGAIYAYKSAFIKNVTFTKNTASDAGGAIYKSGSEYIVIENSIFKGNTAKDNEGGAVYSSGKASVSDSTFIGNSANDEGGAIYTDFIQLSGIVSFINNTAKDHGGAVYTCTMSSLTENAYFESNTADGNYGGALYINSKCGGVSFYNCTFIKNHAKAGDGGAIHSDSSKTQLHFVECVFRDNTAEGGSKKRFGGAVCSSGDIYVSNSTFTGNTAENHGGAIYANCKIYVLGNSQFIKNTATKGEGGAIYCEDLDSIKDSLFISNSAKGDGGAVYVDNGGTITVSNSYFESNKGNSRGGAIYFDSKSAKVSIKNNAFISNTADGQGKDVFNSGEYKSITGNWWGTNSPSFNNEKLMEYHTFGSNEKHKDGSPNTIKISGEKDVYVNINSTFKISFAKGITPFILDKFEISSNMNGTFTNKVMNGNTLEITYVPHETGTHKITVKLNSQTLTLTMTSRIATVFAQDLVKTYGDSETFQAIFMDENGKFLPSGTPVTFSIENRMYKHNISENGIAELDEVLTLSPGVYTITSINDVTGDPYINKLTVLSRNVSYFINETFVIQFANADSYKNKTVTFKIEDKTFKSNITQGYAGFRLDVPPGRHTIDVIYRDLKIQSIDIEVVNKTAASTVKLEGDNYAALVPISENEKFINATTYVYSELGENLRRYVFPTNDGMIVYNVTVSNSAELNKVFKRMSEKDYYVDVTIINLKKGEYQISDSYYKDQEWKYLIHLTHGDLFINGNGATIVDGYHYNFMTIESGCSAAFEDLTFKTFYRVFVNNGELTCTNCNFVENNPKFISTYTPGAVVYNKNKALFKKCEFDSNFNAPIPAGVYHPDLGASFYLESNSLTEFVECEFKDKEEDTIHAVDGSMVVLYDKNKDNYNNFTTGVYHTFEAGSCLDYRPVSSYRVNNTIFKSFNDLSSLISYINNGYHLDNMAAVVINLTQGSYKLKVDDFKKIASPYDFRTYNREHTVVTATGKNDNMNIHHRFLVEVGSAPITIDGHGSTIELETTSAREDNHFAFVPNYSCLTLINMTIKGFNSAIINYGTLIVINCTFESNKIRYTIMVQSNTEYGGVLRNHGKAFFYNTTFKENSATEGGVCYSNGRSAFAQFENCVFKNNKELNLFISDDINNLYVNDSATVKIVNCRGILDSNIKTENDGIVIYRDTVNTTVLNIVVDSLPSLFRLSNIVNENKKYDIINATILKGNYPIFADSKVLFKMDYGQLILSGEGAKIYVKSPKNSDETQFLTTTVHSSVVITGLKIEGFNIAIENKGSVVIANSTLDLNRVDYNVKDDFGGAIVNHEGASLIVYNSSLYSNYAKYGGAIYNAGSAKVIMSNFTDNYGYDDDEFVDIYNEKSAVSIVNVGNDPIVVDYFPMATWKQDVIYTVIVGGITLASFAASYAISATGLAAAHLINLMVGGAIGAIGGTIHAAIYSSDQHDYSTFASKVKNGIMIGLSAVRMGESIYKIRSKQPFTRLQIDGLRDEEGHVNQELITATYVKAAYGMAMSKLFTKTFSFTVDLISVMADSKKSWLSLLI